MIEIEVKSAIAEESDDLSRSTLMLVARSMAEKYRAETLGKTCKKHPRNRHFSNNHKRQRQHPDRTREVLLQRL
jgi:hypothetical protein